MELGFIGKVISRKIVAHALIDSGVEGIIINARFTNLYNFTLIPLYFPFPVCNVNGSENIMGWVQHYTIQYVCIYSQDGQSYYEELVELYVTDIGDHNIILGTDWLNKHNPCINWPAPRLTLTIVQKPAFLRALP